MKEDDIYGPFSENIILPKGLRRSYKYTNINIYRDRLLDNGYIFLEAFICLLLGRKREGERGRETSMHGCLLSAPYWGPGSQPRHVP